MFFCASIFSTSESDEGLILTKKDIQLLKGYFKKSSSRISPTLFLMSINILILHILTSDFKFGFYFHFVCNRFHLCQLCTEIGLRFEYVDALKDNYSWQTLWQVNLKILFFCSSVIYHFFTTVVWYRVVMDCNIGMWLRKCCVLKTLLIDPWHYFQMLFPLRLIRWLPWFWLRLLIVRARIHYCEEYGLSYFLWILSTLQSNLIDQGKYSKEKKKRDKWNHPRLQLFKCTGFPEWIAEIDRYRFLSCELIKSVWIKYICMERGNLNDTEVLHDHWS